ncbi:NUDIX domain-containing protein [Candidatus Parcubacteria bacterium]|nr:NUDIX domain-containing protein [Candidatus Parcubacteria bacterium]
MEKRKYRVVGIIIKDGKVLLMHRLKKGKDYRLFTGGGIEENESPEEALKREIKEETGFNTADYQLAFELENQFLEQYGGNIIGYPKEYYFIVKDFSGEPELGGPEKEKVEEQNQYLFEWVELTKLEEIHNLYPKEAISKLSKFLLTNNT